MPIKLFISILFLTACTATKEMSFEDKKNQSFGTFFDDKEKIKITLDRADRNFEIGKANGDTTAFFNARRQFNFLINVLGHEASRPKLTAWYTFLENYKTFYSDMLKQSVTNKQYLQAELVLLLYQLYP